MKIRLAMTAVCLLALPLFFSPSKSNKVTVSAPFVTIALAGHTLVGSWCQCGTADCICDPDEQSARPAPDPAPIRHSGRAKAVHAENIDLGTGAFLIALALFVLSRFRA